MKTYTSPHAQLVRIKTDIITTSGETQSLSIANDGALQEYAW